MALEPRGDCNISVVEVKPYTLVRAPGARRRAVLQVREAATTPAVEVAFAVHGLADAERAIEVAEALVASAGDGRFLSSLNSHGLNAWDLTLTMRPENLKVEELVEKEGEYSEWEGEVIASAPPRGSLGGLGREQTSKQASVLGLPRFLGTLTAVLLAVILSGGACIAFVRQKNAVVPRPSAPVPAGTMPEDPVRRTSLVGSVIGRSSAGAELIWKLANYFSYNGEAAGPHGRPSSSYSRPVGGSYGLPVGRPSGGSGAARREDCAASVSKRRANDWLEGLHGDSQETLDSEPPGNSTPGTSYTGSRPGTTLSASPGSRPGSSQASTPPPRPVAPTPEAGPRGLTPSPRPLAPTPRAGARSPPGSARAGWAEEGGGESRPGSASASSAGSWVFGAPRAAAAAAAAAVGAALSARPGSGGVEAVGAGEVGDEKMFVRQHAEARSRPTSAATSAAASAGELLGSATPPRRRLAAADEEEEEGRAPASPEPASLVAALGGGGDVVLAVTPTPEKAAGAAPDGADVAWAIMPTPEKAAGPGVSELVLAVAPTPEKSGGAPMHMPGAIANAPEASRGGLGPPAAPPPATSLGSEPAAAARARSVLGSVGAALSRVGGALAAPFSRRPADTSPPEGHDAPAASLVSHALVSPRPDAVFLGRLSEISGGEIEAPSQSCMGGDPSHSESEDGREGEGDRLHSREQNPRRSSRDDSSGYDPIELPDHEVYSEYAPAAAQRSQSNESVGVALAEFPRARRHPRRSEASLPSCPSDDSDFEVPPREASAMLQASAMLPGSAEAADAEEAREKGREAAAARARKEEEARTAELLRANSSALNQITFNRDAAMASIMAAAGLEPGPEGEAAPPPLRQLLPGRVAAESAEALGAAGRGGRGEAAGPPARQPFPGRDVVAEAADALGPGRHPSPLARASAAEEAILRRSSSASIEGLSPTLQIMADWDRVLLPEAAADAARMNAALQPVAKGGEGDELECVNVLQPADEIERVRVAPIAARGRPRRGRNGPPGSNASSASGPPWSGSSFAAPPSWSSAANQPPGSASSRPPSRALRGAGGANQPPGSVTSLSGRPPSQSLLLGQLQALEGGHGAANAAPPSSTSLSGRPPSQSLLLGQLQVLEGSHGAANAAPPSSSSRPPSKSLRGPRQPPRAARGPPGSQASDAEDPEEAASAPRSWASSRGPPGSGASDFANSPAPDSGTSVSGSIMDTLRAAERSLARGWSAISGRRDKTAPAAANGPAAAAAAPAVQLHRGPAGAGSPPPPGRASPAPAGGLRELHSRSPGGKGPTPELITPDGNEVPDDNVEFFGERESRRPEVVGSNPLRGGGELQGVGVVDFEDDVEFVREHESRRLARSRPGSGRPPSARGGEVREASDAMRYGTVAFAPGLAGGEGDEGEGEV